MDISSIARLITEDPDTTASYRDYNKLISTLNKEAMRIGLELHKLGEVDGLTMMLAKPKKLIKGLNNLTVLAGFHGEEPAAVLGIMEFLKHTPDDTLKYINLSIIPTVNPYGFANATRYGKDDKSTNQVNNGDEQNPSENCRILLNNDKLIKELSKNGMLDLHENTDVSNEFYIYANANEDDKEQESSPIKDLTEIARLTALRHFTQRSDGHYKDTNPGKAEYDIKDGVVWNSHDGSYDDHIGKTNPLMVFETPAKDDEKLEARIAAQRDLIESIVAHLGIDASDTSVLALPKAHQTTGNSCGGACLRTIMRYYNIDIPEHKVNELADISDEGIDPEMIASTAAKFGLKPKIFKDWSIKGLKSILDKRMPVIVAIVAWGDEKKDYTKDTDGHYIVASGYDKCRIYFEDPSIKDDDSSKGFLSWREFYYRWHDVDGKMIGISILGENKVSNDLRKSTLELIRIP
jgi:predicted double-glycine peptidase